MGQGCNQGHIFFPQRAGCYPFTNTIGWRTLPLKRLSQHDYQIQLNQNLFQCPKLFKPRFYNWHQQVSSILRSTQGRERGQGRTYLPNPHPNSAVHLGFEQLEQISTSVPLSSKGSTAKKLSSMLGLLWVSVCFIFQRGVTYARLHDESKAMGKDLGPGPSLLWTHCVTLEKSISWVW